MGLSVQDVVNSKGDWTFVALARACVVAPRVVHISLLTVGLSSQGGGNSSLPETRTAQSSLPPSKEKRRRGPKISNSPF